MEEMEAPAVEPAQEVETIEVEAEVEKAPEKTYTQEEFDRHTAKLRRKYERQLASVPEAPKPVQEPEKYNSQEEYVEAVALQKAEQILAERMTKSQHAAIIEEYHDREEAARDRFPDFDQVAYNPNLVITDTMAKTIQSSEIGPDVAYFLGTNPKVAEEISRLDALGQARAIGKIEAKLEANPVTKRVTAAKEPIKPTAGKVSVPAYDTTDPRSVTGKTAEEWIAADRKRRGYTG